MAAPSFLYAMVFNHAILHPAAVDQLILKTIAGRSGVSPAANLGMSPVFEKCLMPSPYSKVDVVCGWANCRSPCHVAACVQRSPIMCVDRRRQTASPAAGL